MGRPVDGIFRRTKHQFVIDSSFKPFESCRQQLLVVYCDFKRMKEKSHQLPFSHLLKVSNKFFFLTNLKNPSDLVQFASYKAFNCEGTLQLFDRR